MYRRAISRFLPISDWLPDCTPTTIRADVIAGIALAGLLCPGGNGLCGHVYLRAFWDIASASGYACIIIGSHAGRSRSSDCRRRLLSICCARFRRRHRSGIIFVVGGLLRLGAVSEFISKPVLKGFVLGLALTIMVKQAHKLTGISAGQGNFFQLVWHVIPSLKS